MKTIDFLRMTKEYEQPYRSYAFINAAIDGLCVLAAPTETPVTLSCTPAMTAALRSGKDAPNEGRRVSATSTQRHASFATVSLLAATCPTRW